MCNLKLFTVLGLFVSVLSITDDLDLGISDEAGFERQLREQGFSGREISAFMQVILSHFLKTEVLSKMKICYFITYRVIEQRRQFILMVSTFRSTEQLPKKL